MEREREREQRKVAHTLVEEYTNIHAPSGVIILILVAHTNTEHQRGNGKWLGPSTATRGNP